MTADRYMKGVDVKTDVNDLPFRDESFDAIVCIHVLEHVLDDHRAMTEFFRVLRRGGWAILQVPLDKQRATTFEDPAITSPSERARAFGQSDHVRIYGRDYGARLQSVGFRVTVDHYPARLGSEAISRFGLLEDEDVYFCVKNFG